MYIKYILYFGVDKLFDSEPGTTSNENLSLTSRGGAAMHSNGISTKEWKPLLLIIPLRLGLSEINPIYFDHLKVHCNFF